MNMEYKNFDQFPAKIGLTGAFPTKFWQLRCAVMTMMPQLKQCRFSSLDSVREQSRQVLTVTVR